MLVVFNDTNVGYITMKDAGEESKNRTVLEEPFNVIGNAEESKGVCEWRGNETTG
jgi:hypothetical protein